MKRVVFLIFILGLIPGPDAMSQSDIYLAAHWYNRANYNPASITRPGYLYLFSDVSQQWAGIDGAPRIFNIQVSEYIHNLHTAFGLSLVSDKIGVTQVLNPMLSYAYRIANDGDWSLSMGLSAGVFSRSLNGSLFEAGTTIDPAIQYDVEKMIRPDANVGFEFQKEHFIFSISSTHLFSIFRSDSLYLNTNHRYVSVYYKNTDSELYSFFGGLQVVNRKNLTILEANACIRFKHPTGLISGPKDLFDLGLTYRSSRQMTLLFGLNISPDFRVGYAYNQSFIPGYYPNGTHEIMVEYRIHRKSASTD